MHVQSLLYSHAVITLGLRSHNSGPTQSLLWAYAIINLGLCSHYSGPTQLLLWAYAVIPWAYAVITLGLRSHHPGPTQSELWAYAVITLNLCSHHPVRVQSCAVDPGAVSSNIYANSRLPSPIRWFIRNMHAPTRDGARAVLHAATTEWPSVSTQPAQLYKPQPHELRVSNLLI